VPGVRPPSAPGVRATSSRASSSAAAGPTSHAADAGLDVLVLGRRVRHLRTAKGMTLDELGAAVGRAASQISMLENGHREPKLSLLQQVAAALDVPVSELLSAQPPTRRATLEVELERAQRGPLFGSLGLPTVAVQEGGYHLDTIGGLVAAYLDGHEHPAAR